ncbi:MAG: hypothetical protein DRP09_10545 [Candidatus Thorarchaeota archaeon]|nr:MAG: hypothetical protein DRP09_10545 [Candidatus Thorarchaeota archaeon]
MTMTTLDTFDAIKGRVYTIKGTGRDAKHMYVVHLSPDNCECTGFKYKGDCIHLQKARLQELTEENDYFRSRYERAIKQRFKSFEMFHDWCWNGKGNPETVYLANLFLVLLYCQKSRTGTTDLIHYAVQEKFTGDPRKIGSVTRRLTEAKLIEKTGVTVPSDRPVCHNAPKHLYKLTEKGKDIIEDIT